jgi:hypothetical protein
MDNFWKKVPQKPAEAEQKTQIVPPFAQNDATQIVKPPVTDDATQIVKPLVPNNKEEAIPEGFMMEEDIPEGITMDDVTQFVPPPVPDDATQIVKRPAVVADDSTQIVQPPVSNNPYVQASIPPSPNPFNSPFGTPPIQHYDIPNHNMTQLVQPKKPMEVAPPPPAPMESRREMGERSESIPAFVKWIGGLALLVLLFNLGHCVMN